MRYQKLPPIQFVTWEVVRAKDFKSVPNLLNTPRTTVSEFQNIITNMFEVTWEKLVDKDRHPNLVIARQLYMYFMHEVMEQSLVNTGKTLRRKHSTVIYGINAVKEHMESKDPAWDDFKRKYSQLKSLIY